MSFLVLESWSKSKTVQLKKCSVLTFLASLSNNLGKRFHPCISNQTRVGQGKAYHPKPIKTAMNAGGRGEDRGIVFHRPSVWLWLYLNLRAYYIYSCDYVAMTAATLSSAPFTGKGQLFTCSFVQLELQPFLTPFSIATFAWIHFASPLTCFFFWKNLLKISLGASSWAGRGSCLNPSVELIPITSRKSSPFLPWNLNRSVCPAFSHTCSRLHRHNTTAQERANHSLVSWKEGPVCLSVCLSVKCVNSLPLFPGVPAESKSHCACHFLANTSTMESM